MDSNPEPKKTKWRLNLFDVIFIACALVAAALILWSSNRTSGYVSVLPAGSQETISYTIELQAMPDEPALLIKPGDTIVDKVERRVLGTIASVELVPARASQKNMYTGEFVISDLPGRTDAIIQMTAQATVTDSKISVDGFAIRAGTIISVTGPVYSAGGFITYVERSEG